MLAASLSDLDGLGILVSEEAYWDYHHKLVHNLLAGLVLAGILATFSERKLQAGILYFGLFHLHLVLDYLGSGQGWEIYYLWPFSNWAVEYRHAWPFYSWQNLSAGFALLVWTLVIAVRCGRTPLETLMPSLDRQWVAWLRKTTTLVRRW